MKKVLNFAVIVTIALTFSCSSDNNDPQPQTDDISSSSYEEMISSSSSSEPSSSSVEPSSSSIELSSSSVEPSSSSIEPSSSSVEPSSSSIDESEGSYTVNDINDYKTVTIGDQVWMAENLNYYVTGSKCYDNDPANCEIYGRLYDWETALTVCPEGWKLPDNDDWDTLIESAGGGAIAGTKLKATDGWEQNGNGTDYYDFTALPGGRGDSEGNFSNVGYDGDWWSATEYGAFSAYSRYMDSYHEYVVRYLNDFKTGLFSVRCIQD